MSITGAGYLAGQFRELLAEVKSDIAKAGESMASAVSELRATADEAMEHVKLVQKETADLKAALGLHSNGPIAPATPAPVAAPPIPPDVREIIQSAAATVHDDTGTVQPIKLASGDTGPLLGDSQSKLLGQ